MGEVLKILSRTSEFNVVSTIAARFAFMTSRTYNALKRLRVQRAFQEFTGRSEGVQKDFSRKVTWSEGVRMEFRGNSVGGSERVQRQCRGSSGGSSVGRSEGVPRQ